MIFARQALLVSGWARDVRVRVQGGVIAQVQVGSRAHPNDTRVDTLLPGLGNLHSHSFQRAMAGMAEARHPGRDSFWTWRDLMYRFMQRLTPEQMEAIAALVFMEMQEAGYTSVAEFHYVHHKPGGALYDNIAELSLRIFAAAATTGIGLTHLPVLYTYGGAGREALNAQQMRFGTSVAQFERVWSSARDALSALPDDARIGIAPHSLRATCPDDLAQVLMLCTDGPIHIHSAEQPKEVADIQAWLGQRPVEWLLDHAPVDARWCLIHATHMTQTETQRMAASGAVAGLCPITEANLGDGAFNGPAYLEAGGAFGVGSDSNINIALGEELRMLEYSQRLRDGARNVMVRHEGSVGQSLYLGAAKGSAQAMARDAGEIAPGKLADLVAIDSQDPALCALRAEQLLDGLVFAAKDRIVTDLWSAGRHCVTGGRHINRDGIIDSYRTAMAKLMQSL